MRQTDVHLIFFRKSMNRGFAIVVNILQSSNKQIFNKFTWGIITQDK